MEFQIYKRVNQLIKSLMAGILLWAGIGAIMLMTGGKGQSEPLYLRWGVPLWGYIVTLFGALILLLLWWFFERGRSTYSKLIIRGNEVVLFKKFPKTEVRIENKIETIVPDYGNWMYNNEDGNVWKVILKKEKQIRILVGKDNMEYLKKWLEEKRI